MDTANHCSPRGEGEGKAREESPRGCNRSAANALRRVIDNDNFVSAVPRTVLTSGLYLLHRAGGPYEWKEVRSVASPKETAERRRGESSAQCAGIENAVPAASRQRIAVFCPIELNVKHGLTSI